MKKRVLLFVALVCFCACAAIPMQSVFADAQTVAKVDGVWCYHGDLNYPMWETGNQFGSALDVSSAYIKRETDQYFYIETLDYFVSYSDDTITQQDTNLYFRFDKVTGVPEIYSRYHHNFRPVIPAGRGMFMKALDLVRIRLGV